MPNMTCPLCRQPTTWDGNPWRPFCSERCQVTDLGAWAADRYRIPGPRSRSTPRSPTHWKTTTIEIPDHEIPLARFIVGKPLTSCYGYGRISPLIGTRAMLPTNGYAAMTAKAPCNPSLLRDGTWVPMTCSSRSPIAASAIRISIKPVTNGAARFSHGAGP